MSVQVFSNIALSLQRKKSLSNPHSLPFNNPSPLPHGSFCWSYTRENKMVIQENALDFYCG